MPSGFWIGGVQVTGDATGGFLIGRIDFLLSPGDVSGFFSLEQMSCRCTSSDITVNLNFQNFIREVLADMDFAMELRPPDGGSEALLDIRESAGLPIFMGSRRLADVTTFVAVTLANSDGRVLTFHAEGYIWTPQAMNVSGGIQRPSNGLYSGH